MKYPRATVTKKSGVRNLQACVTVPTELRTIVGRKQIYKALGTNDPKIANQRLAEAETEIYKMMDDANVLNHPLCKAWAALHDATNWQYIRREYDPETQTMKRWEPPSSKELFEKHNYHQLLFDPEERWEIYDEVRNSAGYVMGQPHTSDPEEGIAIAESQKTIEPLLHEFDLQFRKVSEEKYAPKKRNKRFAEVVDEYHQSNDFINQVKREKTRDDYVGTCAAFLAWAGDVSLDNFEGHEGRALAANFADEMNSPNSIIVQNKRGELVAAGTINRRFAAIRGVLRYAYTQGYTEHRLWDDTQSIVTAKGAKKIKPRPFEPEEEKALMASPMPPRDRLLLQFVITTGARLDEIALLTWDQIKETEVKGEKCWYFILKEDISPVKREASERVVPIHPTMMECLKPYWKNTPFKCKKDKNRLFNYTKGKDGKTTAASKAGMRQIRKLFKDERLVNHSFRYSYVSRTEKIEEAMSPRMANYIQGFALEKSERAGYSTGYLMDQLYPAIKLIDFNFILPPKQISKQ